MLATGVATGILIATSVSVTSAFDAPSDSIGRVIMLVIIAVIVVHALIWYCVPPQVKTKVVDQSVIFSNKHNYIMTHFTFVILGVLHRLLRCVPQAPQGPLRLPPRRHRQP